MEKNVVEWRRRLATAGRFSRATHDAIPITALISVASCMILVFPSSFSGVELRQAMAPAPSFAVRAAPGTDATFLTDKRATIGPARSVGLPVPSGNSTTPAALPANTPSSTHIRPQSGYGDGCAVYHCDAACIIIKNVAVSGNSMSAITVSWTDYSRVKGVYVADAFYSGVYPNNATNAGSVSNHSVTLSLSSDTIYNYQIVAKFTCGSLPAGDVALGCFYTLTSSASMCPAGTLSLSNVQTTVSSSHTSETISWSSIASLNPPGNVPTIKIDLDSVWYNVPSGQNSYIFNGLSQLTTYYFQITASAGAYAGAVYPSANNMAEFNTGTCSTMTEVSGAVYVAGSSPLQPIYGADVFDSGTWVAKTGINGQYQAYYGCVAHSYSLTARAMGFNGNGSVTGSLSAGQQTPNVYIFLQYFPTNEVNWPFYTSSNYTYSFSDYNTGWWTNIGSFVATYVSSASIGGAPDGASQVIQVTGQDSSSTSSPESYASIEMPISDPYVSSSSPSQYPSLSGPLYLSFDVLMQDGHIAGHIGVDAVLSSGALLDYVTDSNGAPIFSSLGTNCYPGDMNYTNYQWVTIYCDLTFLGDTDVTDLLITYDNDATPGSAGTFTAYFDAIDFIEPPYATTIANGGFEAGISGGAPLAWSYLAGSYFKTVTSYTHSGNQAGQLGTTSSSDNGGINTIWQTFRVPSYLDGFNVKLSLWYDSTIGTGGQINAYVEDDRSGDTYYVIPVNTGSSNGWTNEQLGLRPLEGHIITLYIEVVAQSGHASYAYIDDIYTIMQSSTVSESGTSASGTNSLSLDIPRSTYSSMNSGGIEFPVGIGAVNSHWQSGTFGNYGPVSIDDNVSLSANVLSYNYEAVSPYSEYVELAIDLGANATGYPGGPSNPGFVGIMSTCLTATFTQSGDSVTFPNTFDEIASLNMSGSGTPGASAAGLTQEVPDWGILAPYLIEGLAEAIVSASIAEAVIWLAAEIALEGILSLLTGGGMSSSSSNCTGSSNASLYQGEVWDSNGFPMVKELSESLLQVPVGCTSAGCSGGTYDVDFNLSVAYCNMNGAYSCSASPFDTITANLALSFITT